MKKLLTTKEVCTAYSICRTSLWRRVKAGEIPSPVLINTRNYWLAETVNEHIADIMGVTV